MAGQTPLSDYHGTYLLIYPGLDWVPVETACHYHRWGKAAFGSSHNHHYWSKPAFYDRGKLVHGYHILMITFRLPYADWGCAGLEGGWVVITGNTPGSGRVP